MKESHQKYVQSGGANCFKCGSWDLGGGSFTTENGIAQQDVCCNECGHEWTDKYTLTSVVEQEETSDAI